METNEYIQPGMNEEMSFQVEEPHTAVQVGSGSLRVLATPSLIAFMERIAHHMLESRLPQGFSSVGTFVEMRHLAATPAGGAVRVRCEVLEVNGRQVTIAFQAWDDHEKIGEGRHQRVAIDIARFMSKVEAKEAR